MFRFSPFQYCTAMRLRVHVYSFHSPCLGFRVPLLQWLASPAWLKLIATAVESARSWILSLEIKAANDIEQHWKNTSKFRHRTVNFAGTLPCWQVTSGANHVADSKGGVHWKKGCATCREKFEKYLGDPERIFHMKPWNRLRTRLPPASSLWLLYYILPRANISSC